MKKIIVIIFSISLLISSVTDIDGNVYETVQIGDQLWMAENLKTQYYNNGDEIPMVNNSWENLNHGAISNYGGTSGSYGSFDPSTAKEIYGLLYNWDAINDNRNICPEGFHIPSRDEIEELIIYLGGINIEDDPNTSYNETYYENSQISGGKAKEVGTEHWETPNTGATNESGFTGLPGGWRDPTNGYFYEINQRAPYCLSLPL